VESKSTVRSEVQVGSEPGLPRAGQHLPGHLVEHPHRRPDEPAQPGPDRRRRPALIEQLRTRAGTQHIDVRDRVTTGEHRADHRHRLGAAVGPPDRVGRQLQVLVDKLGDPELLGQRTRHDQPRVGDQVVLVEGGFDPGQVCDDRICEMPSVLGDMRS
jgi:hypothetical protein